MQAEKYRSLLMNPFTFWWFKLNRLPSIWIWGLKVKSIDAYTSEIVIKHNYFNKNPFKSIYFSALMGTAEFSTGVLVQQAIMEIGDTSMLVVEVDAKFFKKATGFITFKCNQGQHAYQILSKLKAGDTATLEMYSIGTNETGIKVMEANFTWSFKKK